MARVGTYKVSSRSPWIEAGSITSEEAALDATERDTATAEALAAAKIVTIQPEGRPYAMLLRFRADGAEDLDSVLQLYACKSGTVDTTIGDHYQLIAQLTVVTGQQDTATSTIHFCDTITPASENTLFDGEEVNLANGIGTYYVRTLGCDKFLFVCSDLDSTTVYVDYSLLYE